MLSKQGHSPGTNAAFENHVCQVLVWEEVKFTAMPILNIPEIQVCLDRVHSGQDSFQEQKKKNSQFWDRESGSVFQSSFTIFKDSTLIYSSH